MPGITIFVPDKPSNEDYKTKYPTPAVGNRPALPTDQDHQERDGPVFSGPSHRPAFPDGRRHLLVCHDAAFSCRVFVQNQVHPSHPGHRLQHADGHAAGHHPALDWRPAGHLQPLVHQELPADCGLRGGRPGNHPGGEPQGRAHRRGHPAAVRAHLLACQGGGLSQRGTVGMGAGIVLRTKRNPTFFCTFDR